MNILSLINRRQLSPGKSQIHVQNCTFVKRFLSSANLKQPQVLYFFHTAFERRGRPRESRQLTRTRRNSAERNENMVGQLSRLPATECLKVSTNRCLRPATGIHRVSQGGSCGTFDRNKLRLFLYQNLFWISLSPFEVIYCSSSSCSCFSQKLMMFGNTRANEAFQNRSNLTEWN